MTRAWRTMAEADLDAVAAIARIGFPNHFEDRPMFANRLALAPEGCFVLEVDGRVLGYLIAYPWLAEAAPPSAGPEVVSVVRARRGWSAALRLPCISAIP